ncbi:MAG: terminase family protein, partial [Candidatus Helarchaeota archaeon]|nr:terminase family protein [Candidatus Helarchaeota archaeon]
MKIENYERKDNFEKELNSLTGYRPNAWQKIVREDESRFKILAVGRRGGKSLYVVRDSHDGLVADLVVPNKYVWIVAPNYDLTQRVWNDLYTLAISKFKPIIRRLINSKGNYRLETYLNTVIEAKSADEPEKLVGVGLTKIIIDEAALVQQKAWVQSLRPTLIDHQGSALFISTPKGKNWFWELWMKGQQKEEVEWQSWRFSSLDNEYLNKSELSKLIKDMPDYEYRQEILAQFEETAEQIFRKVKERAVGREKEPAKGHRYQIGVDLGRKTSYSVITVIDEMTNPYEVVKIDRFKTVDWTLQVPRVKAIWEKYPCLKMRVDATGIGDPLTEDLENKGVRVDPYIIKEISKRQYIDKLAILIE